MEHASGLSCWRLRRTRQFGFATHLPKGVPLGGHGFCNLTRGLLTSKVTDKLLESSLELKTLLCEPSPISQNGRMVVYRKFQVYLEMISALRPPASCRLETCLTACAVNKAQVQILRPLQCFKHEFWRCLDPKQRACLQILSLSSRVVLGCLSLDTNLRSIYLSPTLNLPHTNLQSDFPTPP